MNKLVYIKKTNALFLAIVLVAGTITLFSSSFIIKGVNAQTGPEYYDGMDDRYDSYEPDYSDRNNYEPTEYPSFQPEHPSDNSYKSKDNKNVSINKLKCINNNLNINGNNTGDVKVGNKGAAEGHLGTYSSGGDGYYGEGYGKQDNGFDCLINNNNNNTNINVSVGKGNQTVPPESEPTTTLTVTKLVTCAEREEEDSFLSVQQANGPTCIDLLATITENQFNITVGNSFGNVSEFVGSETGTTITLNPNNYTITETPDDSVAQEIANLGGNIAGPIPSFTGDCSQAIPGPFEANIPIAEGESHICNIFNNFVISEDVNGLTAADSPIIAQGTQDSPELTAMEKIIKLKTQWLELLP